MGGLIHHLLAGAASLIFVYLFTKRKDYSSAIFIGNILPDFVGATYAAIVTLSLDPVTILHSQPWFSFTKEKIVMYFWLVLQVVFTLTYLFYHVYIRKKPLHKEIEANLAFLLIGFVMHVIMDLTIIEKGILY